MNVLRGELHFWWKTGDRLGHRKLIITRGIIDSKENEDVKNRNRSIDVCMASV